MSISVDPIVGFNFLSSLTSVFGESITLSLEGTGAARDNTDGLQLSGSGRRAIVTAPSAIKINAPITLMVRAVRVAAGTTGSGAGVGLATSVARYAWEHRTTSSNTRARYDNNGTPAELGGTSSIPSNPSTITYFFEFTASAIQFWMDTTNRLNSVASRSNPIYTGSDVLYFGAQPGEASTNLGANITHAAIWGATLTSDDRTALVADPLAYLASGPSAAAKAHYRRTHLLMEP
jgi:hypothetical protein